VDGVYVKAGLEKDKAAMLVVLAGLRDNARSSSALVDRAKPSTAVGLTRAPS